MATYTINKVDGTDDINQGISEYRGTVSFTDPQDSTNTLTFDVDVWLPTASPEADMQTYADNYESDYTHLVQGN